MITTTDAANILYKDSAIFGLPVFQDGNVPTGIVDEKGRVVIHPKEQSPDSIWKRAFLRSIFLSLIPSKAMQTLSV